MLQRSTSRNRSALYLSLLACGPASVHWAVVREPVKALGVPTPEWVSLLRPEKGGGSWHCVVASGTPGKFQ